MTYFRCLLFVLVCLLGQPAHAQAPADSLRQAALLAARGEVMQLRPLYERVHQRLPRHTNYYCQLAFARAEGRTDDLVALIDTLEQGYERKLGVRGLLALAQERCEALRYQGRWAELARYAEDRLAWAKRRQIRASRQKPLRSYQQLGRYFQDTPSPAVEWRASSFSLPRLAPDSVPVIPVELNEQHQQPALLTPFGRHTIVAASALSTLGINIKEHPTLPITTSTGEELMHAICLDSLRVGQWLVKNLVVYVYDDKNVQVDFPILLGLDVLRRLSTVEIQAPQVLFQRYLSPSNSSRHILFSAGGWLMVNDEQYKIRPIEEEDFMNHVVDFETKTLRP